MALAFWKRKAATTQPASVDLQQNIQPFSGNEAGVLYIYSAKPATDQDFYWQSLEQEGIADLIEQKYLLPWDELYKLKEDEEHRLTLHLLQIPPEATFRPMISSKGALSDPGFRIQLDGWFDGQGRRQESVSREGAILTVAGVAYLLPQAAWQMAELVRDFARLQDNKTKEDNEQYWGKIRRFAQKAHARMDDFLCKTIVLSPEKLELNMRRNLLGEEAVVEIQPVFEDAPASWLSTFDKFNQVQDHYHIPLPDGGMAYVLVDDKVKQVLNEIKKMPGRRVSGKRAQTFLSNPYAQLGEEAAEVVSPESFERAKEQAEIYNYNLRIHTEYDAQGLFLSAVLYLDERSHRALPPVRREISNAEQAVYLLKAYQEADQSLSWAGYEVMLDSSARQQLDKLKDDLDQLNIAQQLKITGQVLDLNNYSERVTGIGEAPVLHSEFIQRDSGQTGWLPEHISNLFNAVEPHVSETLLSDIESKIQQAEESGEQVVQLPHMEHAVSLAEAKELQQRVADKLGHDQSNDADQQDDSPVDEDVQKKKRSVLIIESNIDEVDFKTSRAATLSFDFDTPPAARLPKSFRNYEFSLKAHQHVGVAWLQNIHRLAPSHINGCLLADDMGLGKTLQLLCFIGEYLESTENPKPVLIVAPVSLLENWQAEASRFFNGSFPKILDLYGDNLKSRKIPKHLIPVQLIEEKGISNLLDPDWRGDAEIVLTTYETLRDLQFSLGREKWAIMVCDEAQKIKVPSAMVTSAACAQNADFKIACTGTPVENSLTDLWCLFNFIQPGFLGSLNEFGRKYRRSIEQGDEGDASAIQELRELIEPQILRRMKHEVASLPPKTESDDCKRLNISRLQQQLYSGVVQNYQRVSEEDRGKVILGALHTMRMICAHPLQLSPAAVQQDSPKVAWLLQTLEKIQKKQEKVIIFTEFREIQVFLQRILMQAFGLNVSTVNGDTSASSKKAGASRQGLIDQFQGKKGFNIIILSTTAVGFGVNVQKANHVIHYTRCWNPAKEDQATDRAYRIGQEKEVMVYYPSIYSADFDTFEIKLDKLLSSKRKLASDMLSPVGDISLKDLANEVLQ